MLLTEELRAEAARDGIRSRPSEGEPRTLRLLLASAGRRVGLLQCFRAAASELGIGLVVHATDLDPDQSAASLLADEAHAVPRCDAPDYVEETLRICEREGVDLVVPTIDPELLPLARNHRRFRAIGTRVAVGSVEAVGIARDKIRTAERLRAAGVPVPRTTTLEAARGGALGDGPFFVKPVGGSASRGLARVERAADLPIEVDEPMLVQRCLRGPEYTVNSFVDGAGRWCASVPHRRHRVRAGEVEKGETVRDERFTDIARRIAYALPGFCLFETMSCPSWM